MENITDTLSAYDHANLEGVTNFDPDGIIARESTAACNRENFALCLSCMDYTSLDATDTEASVSKKIAAAREKSLAGGLPGVASACVFPRFASVARRALSGSSIRTSVVGGGFPSGGTFLEVKRLECERAIAEGAEEVDVIIPVGLVLENNFQRVQEELLALRESCAGAVMKVILETGELKEATPIFNATLLGAHAGADFVKTSTGKTPVGATPAAVSVMCEALRQYRKQTGRKVGIKISGGITTPADAILYLTIIRHELGAEYLTPRLFRIGASRLLDELLKATKE
ncbi:MAG: deoxyribose-phosphate aldolase [Odoribacteraceae bacterium]|jgi:deoxyribose-phosphate aldolase|nr:deoxyribose-phosphate aldolase [Odoribacteraceae bacterium]